MADPCCGTRTIDDVVVEWRCKKEGPACDVKLRWRGSLIVATTLNRSVPTVPFSASDEDDTDSIAGELILRCGASSGGELLLDLRFSEGEISQYRLWPSASPPPPPPPPSADRPVPEEIGVAVQEVGDADLFPYIYLRPWPRVRASERRDRFVEYPGDCPGGKGPSLYCQLLADRDDRLAMEQDAIDFIDGRPPYAGQFLVDIESLDGPIRTFGAFDAGLRTQPDIDLSRFKTELEAATGLSWVEISAYVRLEPAYRKELDRCWQNLFALAVTLGYDTELLDDVVRTVVAASLVDRVVESEPGSPNQIEELWPTSRLREGAWATVVLPPRLFPLPAASSPPTPREAARHWRPSREGEVVPYAIGDLQLVRQRLERYELGEVCAIENYLQGESKETTRRKLNRTAESSESEVTSDDQTARSVWGTRADLLEETRNTLSLDFKVQTQTQYGPPQEGTATGYIEVSPNEYARPQAEAVALSSQFARSVTARTEQRLARFAAERRARLTLDEVEETVSSRFDASSAAKNARGIYRWVNKVYKAWVVNYGHRLVLEFLIPHPARRYISGEASLQGLVLSEPDSPQNIGLRSFRDVSPDPGAALFYGDLAARYQARDVSPPPRANVVAGVTFQGGPDVHVQDLVVPDGYEADTAYVTANWAEQAPSAEVFGIVGRSSFHIASISTVRTVPIAMERQTGAVSVAVSGRPVGEPSQGLGSDGFLVTVEVDGRLSEDRLEGWQIETYNALIAGYERLRGRYHADTGTLAAGPRTRNPLGSREAVRTQLRRDITARLFDQAIRLTGEHRDVALGRPRYHQFFDKAFEWSEMAYSFTVRTGEAPSEWALNQYQGEDELFTAFLQAGLARVLVPVRADFSYIVPYFLASGTIWDGENFLTAANEASVSLINELKTSQLGREMSTESSEPWLIRVPTPMVVLQDGSDLPGVRSAS